MSIIQPSAIQPMLEDSARVSQAMVAACALQIATVTDRVVKCLTAGRKLLICGNGGSAAQAQHFAAEFVNRYKINRQPWPALALHTDTSALTSIGNDAGFEYIFSKQIEAFGQSGDLLFALTSSDIPDGDDRHSQNLVMALKVARERGLTTVGLISTRAKRIQSYLDHAIVIPSEDTPRIQEGHGLALHCICELAEQALI